MLLNMLKVLMVSTEVEPFAKTGGLGDVIGALPVALNRLGVDARVIMPKYKVIPEKYKNKMEFIKFIYIKLGWRNQYCGIFKLDHNGTTIYFLDNEYYFGGDGIYGYDDLEKYCFMEKAVLEILPSIEFQPDIIHCHDWQTGLIPVLLDHQYRSKEFYKDIKTICTIHNLQYQGLFDKGKVWEYLGLSDHYFTSDKLEFHGAVNFLKGGLVYADYITTVSDTYADEIKYAFYGEHLEGLLSARSSRLIGILNGIDYNRYSPSTDSYLIENYDVDTYKDKKIKNKLFLQEKLDLAQDPNIPIISMVTRLVNQKGLDLVEAVIDQILALNLQMVILGTGDPRYEKLFRHCAWAYHSKVSANILFDDMLAHQIYAGSDIFLMPSLYEPCGLGQIISMSYGTIPVVREVGGLKDTVSPYNQFTNEGNGFSFANYNAHEMLSKIESAVKCYNNPEVWDRLVTNAMLCDYSWGVSAQKYIDVYSLALKG